MALKLNLFREIICTFALRLDLRYKGYSYEIGRNKKIPERIPYLSVTDKYQS